MQELVATKERSAGDNEGDGIRIRQDLWRLPELVQAVTIISHFHAYASFFLGCGTMSNDEKQQEDGEKLDPSDKNDDTSGEEKAAGKVVSFKGEALICLFLFTIVIFIRMKKSSFLLHYCVHR